MANSRQKRKARAQAAAPRSESEPAQPAAGTPAQSPVKSWSPSHPEAVELTEEEWARRHAINRRAGRVIAIVCIAVAVIAAGIFLTMNRDTADEGARTPHSTFS